MRAIVTIAHYFSPEGVRRYGSGGADPTPRIAALAASLESLQRVFGDHQYMFDIAGRAIRPANEEATATIDIVICTSAGRHLLADLPASATIAYSHCATESNPVFLGFECQAVLREALGKYDYYCYLEDDIIVGDPWFFTKLAWFSAETDPAALLQPNRYECDSEHGGRKAYIDGEISRQSTAAFQDVDEDPVIRREVLGKQVVFRRPLNPHSGCFFLTEAQMDHWARQSHFLDRDTSFIGPLESAASLGIMRTFKVYKPTREVASFLEVLHAGRDFISRIAPEQTMARAGIEPATP